MDTTNTDRAERIAQAAHIISKIDGEQERERIIDRLAEDGDFTAEELLKELSKPARQRLAMEAEMPLPTLSPPLDAPH
jgi:DNA primase